MENVSIIIPARYGSTRFPGKPLAEINDKPMILHVADNCSKAFGADCVNVVTDDIRIEEAVTHAGYRVYMTYRDQKFRTGSDRVAYIANYFDSNYIIDVQGDEPLVRPEDIIKVYDTLRHNPGYVVNCYSLCDDDNKSNRNTIKVVLNQFESKAETLLYMSRAPLEHEINTYKRQVCIYGWPRSTLLSLFGENKLRSHSEIAEDVHILRTIDNGYNVIMVGLDGQYQSVDVPDDIQKVKKILNEKK